MFALIVVFGYVSGEAICRGAQGDGAPGEAGYVFEQVGVFDGCCWGLAPGERGVAGDEDARDGDGVEVLFPEEAGYDRAGVEYVGFGYFFGGEWLGDRDGAVEVIGVGGAEAGDGLACLGPGGGEFGVGMNYAADLREFAIEEQMGIEVAGGAEREDGLAANGGCGIAGEEYKQGFPFEGCGVGVFYGGRDGIEQGHGLHSV